MKLHFAIAHYFNPLGDGRHGSLSKNAVPRVKAIKKCILQLHRLFGSPDGTLNHMKRRVDIIKNSYEIKVSICVTGNSHLIDELKDSELVGGFEVIKCSPKEPKLLGFECHRILKEREREYDYNCFLEDDIVITDPEFFKKLTYFNHIFGDNYLLQPNRIETGDKMSDIKHFYIDGDYNPKATMEYRKAMGETLIMSHLGESVRFKQPFNTHSGCFFLNKNQSRMYFESGVWSEKDISFHGPLESAATLGVMKKFQIVKPALENGKFLTVEHAGKNFMGMVSIEGNQ